MADLPVMREDPRGVTGQIGTIRLPEISHEGHEPLVVAVVPVFLDGRLVAYWMEPYTEQAVQSQATPGIDREPVDPAQFATWIDTNAEHFTDALHLADGLLKEFDIFPKDHGG